MNSLLHLFMISMCMCQTNCIFVGLQGRPNVFSVLGMAFFIVFPLSYIARMSVFQCITVFDIKCRVNAQITGHGLGMNVIFGKKFPSVIRKRNLSLKSTIPSILSIASSLHRPRITLSVGFNDDVKEVCRRRQQSGGHLTGARS